MTKKMLIWTCCSTGTTIGILDQHLRENQKTCRFVGADNSAPMIEKATENLNNLNVEKVKLLWRNIEDVTMDENVDMIIMNYTLQFIREDLRPQILKNILNALSLEACLFCQKNKHK